MQRASAEERSTSRKRAISEGSDVDCEMLDADRPHKQPELGFLGGTAFKNPTWSFPPTPDPGFVSEQPTPGPSDAAESPKRKGIDLNATSTEEGLLASLGDDPRVLKALEHLPPPDADTLSQSMLWNWEPRRGKYGLNWKYLYSMRRRLESNWELGRFTNFQFPHPNHPDEGHTECVYSLQFTPEYLVSGSRDRSIRVWSIHTRRLLLPPLLAHSGSVLCLQFDPDPEEDLIVSGSSDSDVILWKFSTGEIMQRLYKAHRESVLNVRFDKRILVTCSKDRSIKIFNRRPLRYGDDGYPQSEVVNQVPVNVKNYGYEPNLADELPVIEPYTMIGALYGHNAAVNAVQICGREIVSASGDKAIKVWDWPKQKCNRTILGHIKGIACVQYDGRRIVSGSSDNEVKVFDSSTGLEVASLRAHSNLVRTVQAGFGDLPDSAEADREAARQVDEEYFRALESGAVVDGAYTTAHSRRRGNAGSRRPQDITAYGANLPPGGGGGRYARIVSGSYDQSIIIWRRDKEGLWKDIHRLQQDKAAAAAQRQAIPPAPAPAQTTQAPGPPPAPRAAPHPSFLLTPEQIRAIIDAAVPRGLAALEEALAAYPAVLTQQSHVQAAIDGVGSPYMRNQMRGAVQGALERVMGHSGGVVGVEGAAGQAQAQIAQGTPMGQVQGGEDLNAQGTATGQAPSPQPQQAVPPNANTAPNPQMQNPAANAAAQPANQAQAAAATAAAQQQQQQQAQHPHITETSPARVFKLQFDARRIICCCQTPVIVGWDFCQGDPELEAVSRFFATIS